MKTIYVDAAASALKPGVVIRAESDFLKNSYANAARGVCGRASDIDNLIADTRKLVAKFIGLSSQSLESIIFTGGTTDGINRVANMLARDVLTPESVVVVSDLDHHSARLPFEDLAKRGKCKLVVCPLTADFEMDTERLQKICEKENVAAVVISAMSNVLGAPADVAKIVKATKSSAKRTITIVDAAQSAAHNHINVSKWNADVCVFSGHKIGADTGLGILYLKNPEKWNSSNFGGGMYRATGAARFEAGTLPLTQIVGLSALLKSGVRSTDPKLMEFLRHELSKNPKIKFISKPGAAMLTFAISGMHPLDFGILAGARGVCLRVGDCCASWLVCNLGVPGVVRISLGPWNTMAEMKKLVKIIGGIIK